MHRARTGSWIAVVLSLVLDKLNPVATGERLSYRARVTNHGLGGATGVLLTGALSRGLDIVSVKSSLGTCRVNGKQRTVLCDLEELAAGDSASVTVQVVPRKRGTVSLGASVAANEPDPVTSNNADTETTSVLAAQR
jgi:uncharacterized repeat protein (TIGR01451 family)